MAGAARTPPLSLLLGYGPMALFPAFALCAWWLPNPWGSLAINAAQIWGGVLLVFLAGVRRGLSFFTQGGPRPAQIATMFWLFLVGLLALLTPARVGLAAEVIGFGSIAILDPAAARRGEAPEFFAHLRPPQMAVALAGLVMLFARVTF